MRIAILVVGLYVITAYLGLKLAVPAGYATAIWAPAGIALGATLIWGVRALPSVFVASFLINFYISYLNTDLLQSLLVAMLIATGAVWQAWFGRWLVQRIFGVNDELIHPKDILLFAFVTGPVSCLINASWSVLTLYYLDLLPLTNMSLSWMTWWVGDCMGVLLITPIFLIYFRQTPALRRYHVLQRVFPLCLSFVAVIFIYSIVMKTETSRIRTHFDTMTRNMVNRLNDHLKIAMNTELALTAHLNVIPEVNKSSFTNYAQTIVAHQEATQILSWLPEVRDKTAFEAENHVRILTKGPNGLIPAPPKEKHYPVLYVEPYEDHKGVIGYDLLSETVRARALQEALRKNKLVVSAPITLVLAPRKDRGILLISPVYNHSTFTGFAMVVLNLTQISDRIFNQGRDFYRFEIWDKTSASEVFRFQNPQNKVRDDKYAFTYQTQLNFGDNTWEITAVSSMSYINRAFSWQIWSVLPSGLLFCVLMNLVLLMLYGQEGLVRAKINEQRAMLQAEEEKNLLVLNSAGEGILEFGVDGKISFANPAALTLLGYTNEELAGKSITDLLHNRTRTNRHIAATSPSSPPRNNLRHHADDVFFRKNGASFTVEYSSTPIKKNGAIIGSVMVFNDVTEQRENQLKIERMAKLDMLTGLPNRFTFMEQLSQALARAVRNNSIMAVCFIDIDNFKQINDNYGHPVGDRLLKMIPKLFATRLRDTDFLARLGGDEFGLILENIHAISELSHVAEDYIKIASSPLKILDHEINTSISMGIATYPNAGGNAEELLTCADIAMYHAKEEGKNTCAFFNEDMNVQLKRRHQIDVALRHAIENNEFYVVYQPQLNTLTQAITGVEVLIRLESQDLLTVTPGEFIPVAESNGLILEIGRWILQQVALDYRKIITHDPGMKININTSVKQLESPTFYDFVYRFIRENHINPRHIFLEVTETALMKKPQQILDIMHKLHAEGIRFALDDFGTGYSSMHYLKKLPVSVIKIDQSFVQDITKDPNDATIVNATIKMAHGLNILTIAEGVETKEQLTYLTQCGCDQVQGYYLAKPMRIDQLMRWLKERNADSA